MLILAQPLSWWAGSLAFWTGCVIKFPHKTSDIHAISIVALSLASLSSLIPEAPRHVLSMTYFMATGVQMILRRDHLKVLHHGLSILAGTLGLVEIDGLFLEYKLSSRILLIEFSTPLLHWYKASGSSKKIGAAFAISFISLRTFWLGHVVYELLADAKMRDTWTAKLMVAQWLLNQYWSAQIINKFAGGKSSKGGEKTKAP
jgi:hypothetical protein